MNLLLIPLIVVNIIIFVVMISIIYEFGITFDWFKIRKKKDEDFKNRQQLQDTNRRLFRLENKDNPLCVDNNYKDSFCYYYKVETQGNSINISVVYPELTQTIYINSTKIDLLIEEINKVRNPF